MKKIPWKKVFLIAFLICVTMEQRGGGGGSRGGGGGGGGGGSRGGGYFSSGRTGYYGSSNWGGGGSLVGQILGGVIFGIVGIVMFLVYCLSCRCCCKNQVGNQQINQNEFQNQKIQNNRVNTTNISDQQFQLKLNQYVDLIKGAANQVSSFTYSQGLFNYPINNADVTFQKQADFLYRIQMKGADQLGAWSGKGYFLNTDTGVAVWWMKDYYNKDVAGQTGQWSHLVYKSTQCNYKDWNGVWYFAGFQSNPQYSGTWNLSLKNLPANTNIQQNQINNNFSNQNYNGPAGGFSHNSKYLPNY